MFKFFKKEKKEIKKVETEKIDNVDENVYVYVKYSYEWNDKIPDDEKDTPEHPSRPFCKRLIELNRLYTRGEIERISQRVGYSVWERRGGEGCRHHWKSNIVVKKEKKDNQ